MAKLTTLFIIVSFLQISANSYSQTGRLNLNLKNATILEVFGQIESTSNYRFFYDNDQIDLSKKVSIITQNEKLSDILNEVFDGTDLAYKVKDMLILVQSKNTKSEGSGNVQQKSIIGKVTDESGQPLPGVSIAVNGTTTGTITGEDGSYSLSNIPENAVLQFSFIGMKGQKIIVGNKSVINVTLVEDAIGIEEVVAIGYGSQKKADLTGAVANMKAKDLNVESNTNIIKALQGKMSGVEIVSTGGDPGNTTTVMIRGVGTFNNNTPLYIVDGMYMDNINFLNPNDIESIDVLKDASSAAIYGSRAANGVIIVTTKSGQNTNGTPTISISTNLGMQNITKKIGVLNAQQWIDISTTSRAAAGRPALDMALAPQADIDWQDELTQPGLLQNYNLSAQGGSKNFKYYVGGGYTNQEGVIVKTGYERMNLQVKTEFKKGIISVGENILVSNEKTLPVDRSVSRSGGIVGSMLNSIPTYNIYDASQDGGYNGPWGDAITWANPVGIVSLQKEEREYNKTYVNVYAMVDLPFDLQYKLNLNTNVLDGYSYSFTPHYTMGLNTFTSNTMSESRNPTKSTLVENLLTFNKSFGNHKLTMLAGYTFQNNKFRSLGASGTYMPDGITVVDAATETRGSSNQTVNALTSYLFRIFYSYKDRYLINATIRRDGSSKFIENNRYGNFPSLSVGWNIHKEAFMSNIKSLNMLKFRAGYGVLGNQEVGNYVYSSTVSSNINYLVDGNTIMSGSFPKVFASPSIKWENTEMTNIGLDAAFLNNRLKTTFEYYEKNTTDILLNVPIPTSTGSANNPLVNAGQIRNKGFEMMVGWDNVIAKDWSYSINLVGSKVKNEVIKMGTGDQVIWSGTPNQSGASTTKSLQGYPIGGFWLIETDGIFQSEAEVTAHSKDGVLIQPNAKAGDIRFKDQNNDGKINDDDRVYKGSPFPGFTMGLSAMLKWKNFDMSVSIQGNFGAKIYNSMRPDMEDVSKGTNYLTTVLDHWSVDNPNSNIPRLIWGDPNQNSRTNSDRFLENGDYVRITNLQLGYNIPKNLMPYFEAARVYANIDNLYTFTNYSGFTPDVNNSNVLQRGVDKYTYPLPRTISLGLNFSF